MRDTKEREQRTDWLLEWDEEFERRKAQQRRYPIIRRGFEERRHPFATPLAGVDVPRGRSISKA